jgi:hypothetical protein
MWLFFRPFFFCPPSVVWFDFFNRVFGHFVTRRVQKHDKKKTHENLLSSQKKHLLTYVTFFFFAAPLGGALSNLVSAGEDGGEERHLVGCFSFICAREGDFLACFVARHFEATRKAPPASCHQHPHDTNTPPAGGQALPQ